MVGWLVGWLVGWFGWLVWFGLVGLVGLVGLLRGRVGGPICECVGHMPFEILCQTIHRSH